MPEPSSQPEQASQERRPVVGPMLRHPLTAIFIGFLLTGVVGTVISNQLASQRQREADIAHLRETRRDAIRGLSRLVSERLLRMQILMTAIERHYTPQAITELKRLYDDSETKFALGRGESFLLAREILGESDMEAWRSEMETRITRKRFLPLRECLEKASDAAAKGEDGAAILKEGNAARLLQECQAGADVLVDGLYELATVSSLSTSDPEAVKVRERFRKRFEQVCP
ncbi:MAG: hypothetical protein ACE15C_15080 [Phycisphaerae bacterium]